MSLGCLYQPGLWRWYPNKEVVICLHCGDTRTLQDLSGNYSLGYIKDYTDCMTPIDRAYAPKRLLILGTDK